jgi:hypothetical protein
LAFCRLTDTLETNAHCRDGDCRFLPGSKLSWHHLITEADESTKAYEDALTVPDVRRESVHVERAHSTAACITPLSDGRRPQKQESMAIEPDCKGGADSAGQPERRGEVVVGKSAACIARVTQDVVSFEVTRLGNQLPIAHQAETLSRPSLEQEAATGSMGRLSAGHGRRVVWGHASAPSAYKAGAPRSEVEGGRRQGGTPQSFLDGFLRLAMLAGPDEPAPRSDILRPLPCTHSENPLNDNEEGALHTRCADKPRLGPEEVERAHQVRAAAFSQPIPASVPPVGLEIDSAPPHQVPGTMEGHAASTPRPLPLPPRPLEAPPRTDKQGVAKPTPDGPHLARLMLLPCACINQTHEKGP